ncbi:MAG: polysaccharide deacetylase family protein [Gammaproteobacteria bacterium]|nr:polysaccharide deacetylase family protein [Gammaproteobacteria bacterium]
MVTSYLPTLMFHGLVDKTSSLHQAVDEEFYTIDAAVFRQILSLIAELDKKTATTGIISNTGSFDSNRVILSFDDGWMTDYTIATPLLGEFNMSAAFFIVTDFIGKDSYLTAMQIKAMHQAAMDIQIHGKTHEFLTLLNNDEIIAQLQYAKNFTEDLLGKNIDSLSFPGGRGDDRVIDIATSLGFTKFFSSRPGWYQARTRDIPRVVIHQQTLLPDVCKYLTYQKPVLYKSIAKYHAGRLLVKLVGQHFYNRLKVG